MRVEQHWVTVFRLGFVEGVLTVAQRYRGVFSEEVFVE